MATIPDDMLRRHPFTVRDFYRMADAGIFRPDARVELIDGEIIDMPPIGSRHAGTVNHLSRILQKEVGDLALVQVQNPVSLDGYSEPVPDIALLQPRADFYKSALPGASDVLLIIEVADTTLRYDRAVKAQLYARHAIGEYWIVVLERRRIERYRDPREAAYAAVDWIDLSQPAAPAALPDLALDLGHIFAE